MNPFMTYVDSVSVIMAGPLTQKWHKTTMLLFQFIAKIQKTASHLRCLGSNDVALRHMLTLEYSGVPSTQY